MVSLTLEQRNILHHLLNSPSPVAISKLATRSNLTSRQVNYRLKSINAWLSERDVVLKIKPGVGVAVHCAQAVRMGLLDELTSQLDFQLVLTSAQRQQLLALNLLTTDDPLILHHLQYITAVSRSTALKDMDSIEAWGHSFGLKMVRKPNYGVLFEGVELARRQAIAALLWGDSPFIPPLTSMIHGTGLSFSLTGNHTLPIIKQIDALLAKIKSQTAFEWLAFAENQLGGRFTDDAVLHLALALALQDYRVRAGRQITVDPDRLHWLQSKKMWSAAESLSNLMWPDLNPESLTTEIASVLMHLLAGLRNHLWPGDLDIEPSLTEMVTALMAEVAMAFSTPGLRQDIPLRDGLISHIIPAFMRQRFGLWAPPSWSDGTLSSEYPREHAVAKELATLVTEHTDVVLPDGDIDTLTLLLRAAFIRERPTHPKRIYLVCPSGMATAQLLVARLKARFPSLEILGVLSIRELSTERVAEAQLLISTAPIQSPRPSLQVIQVHPLLSSEDIEIITNWLTLAVER